MQPFDIDYARDQFPQFRNPETRAWAFMENAGGAYAPDMVIEKLLDFYRHTKLQPYYPYEPSRQAGAAMDRSQRLIASLINAETEEVHLGPSTTSNVYVLAQALAEELSSGEEIVVTDVDHEANVGAWRRLAARGIVVREWRCNPQTGQLATEDLDPLLNTKTRLVCVTHCSNVTGIVTPVETVVEKVHSVGARVVVDGVSHAPHAAVDVKSLGVDFYLFSLYKVFGPHLGVLYTRADHLQRIAHQGHFFNADQLGKRLTPAGPNHGEYIAAAGVVDYFSLLADRHAIDPDLSRAQRIAEVFSAVGAHESSLVSPLRAYLQERSGVRVLGAGAGELSDRAPIVSFLSDRRSPEEVARGLADHCIGCGHGNFYAYRLFERLGLDPNVGAVRISIAHYNTREEMDRLLGALDTVL